MFGVLEILEMLRPFFDSESSKSGIPEFPGPATVHAPGLLVTVCAIGACLCAACAANAYPALESHGLR